MRVRGLLCTVRRGETRKLNCASYFRHDLNLPSSNLCTHTLRLYCTYYSCFIVNAFTLFRLCLDLSFPRPQRSDSWSKAVYRACPHCAARPIRVAKGACNGAAPMPGPSHAWQVSPGLSEAHLTQIVALTCLGGSPWKPHACPPEGVSRRAEVASETSATTG